MSPQRLLRCRMKPYIQPFERRLAVAELATLARALPHPLPSLQPEPDVFEVSSFMPPAELADRLAYWEVVVDGVRRPTTQVLREATIGITRRDITIQNLAARLPFRDDVPLPNRRCLRYGTHGIHDYRGKFFPQLVRALLNVADVRLNGVVADPMCGSGTTLVEAVLSDRTALGLDLNPLSVFLSRTKTSLLFADPGKLGAACEHIENLLSRQAHVGPSDPRTFTARAGPRLPARVVCRRCTGRS